MRSSSSFKLLDLEHDLPTTREDVLALRKAREHRPLTLAAYLEFLGNFPHRPISELRARKSPTGSRPFEL